MENNSNLDFSGLFSIKKSNLQTHKTHPGNSNNSNVCHHNETEKNKAEGITEPRNSNEIAMECVPALPLVRKAKQQEAQRKTEAELTQKYIRNVGIADGLRAEILKGMRAGTDIYSLFLKACKVISLTTSDPLFYNQAQTDIRTIYGRGYGEQAPLQDELKDIEDRIQKLLEAVNLEQDTDARKRIENTIKAQRNAAETLRHRMKDAERE